MRAFVLLAALLLGLAAPLTHADTVIRDRVAAIVDDDVIMESEVQARIADAMTALRSRKADIPPEDVMRAEIVKMMVLESIQLQMGDRAGVRISDAMLNDAIAEIAARNGMTPEVFRNTLAAQGIPYDKMREQVRVQMITQRVQRGHVSQKVHVSEDEITSFLASDEGRALIAPEFHLEHLLLPLPEGASEAQANSLEATARQLLAAHRNSPLAPLAKTPGLPVAARYTDLDWRKAEEIPSLFADSMAGLEPGATAGPFRNSSGIHLIRLIERRGADHHIVQQTHARHILLKISEIRSEDQARALAEQLRKRAQSGEDFADLARQYSEDIGSAMEGGDLGWANPGQFVPVFEATMDKTAAGEIAPPFRSEFGWHVLQVLERRQQDVGELVRRNMARQFLFERKYQDELQAWLTRIRDEAYVDIKH